MGADHQGEALKLVDDDSDRDAELRRLHAIVRDLAAAQPPLSQWLDTGTYYCTLCKAESSPNAEQADVTIEHAPSCPWRRARECFPK